MWGHKKENKMKKETEITFFDKVFYISIFLIGLLTISVVLGIGLAELIFYILERT